MDVLEVSRLTVRYGDRTALAAASFTLAAGELVVVTGPSGAGKSTLALSIVGGLPENASMSGAIRFHGRAIAPIFQEPSGALHPLLRAGDQVAEVVRARIRVGARESNARARQAFARAGLESQLYDGWPHQLSGGQRQRVLIAQALAAEPDLIVADEPVASLDMDMRGQTLQLFRELRDNGVTILFITHRPGQVKSLANRTIRLEGGALVAHAA